MSDKVSSGMATALVCWEQESRGGVCWQHMVKCEAEIVHCTLA